jgi:hypothetical protein
MKQREIHEIEALKCEEPLRMFLESTHSCFDNFFFSEYLDVSHERR